MWTLRDTPNIAESWWCNGNAFRFKHNMYWQTWWLFDFFFADFARKTYCLIWVYSHFVFESYQIKPTKPNLQNKPTKPNVPNQTYQTYQPNLPIQTYQTKPTKLNLPKRTYQTKLTKPNLPNQSYQIKPTKPNLPN